MGAKVHYREHFLRAALLLSFCSFYIKSEVGLLENLSQHFKTFEFLESWDMKTVETHHNVDDTVSLRM